MSEQHPTSEVRPGPANTKKYWYAAGLLAALALIFWAGSWYGRSKEAGLNETGKRVLYYVDPMNPSHTSPEPGLAPCGMKMEPVYADEAERPAGLAMSPGAVKITPEKQQMVGVRVAKVEVTPWTYTLRTLGKVAVDEHRIYRVNAFTEGWIVRAYHNSTGSIVRRDEPLATFYSKDLPTALQTYFYASHALDSLSEGQKLPAGQIDALEAQKRLAEGGLMNLGMGRLQIEELARTRQITQEVVINAPVTSFVLARNITPGQKFVSGEELYRLADLSRVWVLADLYGSEADYVRPGDKVRVRLPHQDHLFVATVSEVLPEFNPTTLTLKVRLEVNNPNFTLRPGMFTDVEFPIQLAPAINIPVDAVMDAGVKQTVFVDRGNGFFEPRQVKTGWRLGDRVEIVEGLKPGESIVVSGNFLIDSESRMKLAAAGMFGEVTQDPVCGLNVDMSKAKAAGYQSTFNNQPYFFCSQGCQQHFEKNPGRYAEKKAEAGGAEAKTAAPVGAGVDTAIDLVCGQEVSRAQARARGLTSEYGGKTYYFSSYACNKDFDKDPGRYVTRVVGSGEAGAGTMLRDPVCGLPVATGTAKEAGRTSEFEGKTFYFDTEGCKQRFDNDPQRYLAGGLDEALPQKYPNVPTDPNLLLRLRRDFLRALPTWKIQELPPGPVQVPRQSGPGAVPPAAPQAPPQLAPPEPCPGEQPGAGAVGPPDADRPLRLGPLEPQAAEEPPRARGPADSPEKGQPQ